MLKLLSVIMTQIMMDVMMRKTAFSTKSEKKLFLLKFAAIKYIKKIILQGINDEKLSDVLCLLYTFRTCKF